MNTKSATEFRPPRAPGKSTEDHTIAEATSAIEALAGTLEAPRIKPTDSSGDGPAFDVARIGPTGEAVIAGRAAPGASVELLRAGRVHDKTVADQSGEFVFVPNPLPPGDYSLTLRSTQSDGTVSTSKSSVAVVLRSGKTSKPDVALPLPGKPADVPPSVNKDGSRSADIAIVAVESKGSGKLYVSGQSEPGATVKFYLNGSYIASTTASADGHVAFAISSGVVPGDYRVRLDLVDGTASVHSRAEDPFNAPAVRVSASASFTVAASPRPDTLGSASDTGLVEAKPTLGHSTSVTAARPPAPPVLPRTGPELAAAAEVSPKAAASQSVPNKPASASDQNPNSGGSAGQQLSTSPPSASGSAPQIPAAPIEANDVVVPRIDTTVVSRGDNLWYISRSTYGQGMWYFKIYDANRDRIRDPDLIFPGQVFVLPKAPSGK
jgi:hypothetical protein